MSLPSVYLETTFVSYLTGRESRDIDILSKQMSSKRWWEVYRHEFRLFVSEPVIREVSRGDSVTAAERLAALQGIDVLETTPEAARLAKELLDTESVPKKAVEDALHIAVAASHGMDFLLSLNFRHINNGVRRKKLEQVCMSAGFVLPQICTPDELMGEDDGELSDS